MHPASNDFVRLARNCYVAADDVDDLRACAAAALATSAEFTVLASVSAARLHGLWLPALPGALHLATATPQRAGRAMTRTRRPQFVAHRLQLPPEDVVEIEGLQVTAPARTWRDLAAVLSLPQLVAAGDSALRAGATVDELRAVLVRAGRARGVVLARAALPLLDVRSRSRPESHLRVAVSARDLPRFEVNEPVHRDEGGWLAEPDLSLAEAKIALEYQGSDHAELRRMRRDLTRGIDMRDDEWLVLPYGPAEVFGRPHQIEGEVRRAIAARAPHLLRPAARRRARPAVHGRGRRAA